MEIFLMPFEPNITVTAIADFNVIAGTVYQAPDVKSVINSRLTTTLHHIESAFSEAILYSRYHPSKGYWWQFNEEFTTPEDKKKSDKTKVKKEEPGSMFQCRRVDQLLVNLSNKFPHKYFQHRRGDRPTAANQSTSSIQAPEIEDSKKDAMDALSKPSTTQNILAMVNARSLQSPVNVNPQIRIKPEPGDIKPPAEKRTKFM